VHAIEAGEPVPGVVLATVTGAAGDEAGAAARSVAGRVLGLVQGWLAAGELEPARLVVVTRGAVAAGPAEGVVDLAGAAVWGLVRSAQSENPGRLVLADVPAGLPAGSGGGAGVAGVLAAALAEPEPELAVREGAVFVRRLARPVPGLVVPAGDSGPWRLDVTGPGTLDALALVACPEAAGPLGPGQVRVAVRAAGMNFRDVLVALGMYPGAAVIGGEVAGVVTGTGPGAGGLVPGDRVMGLVAGGFGPVAVADARLLVRIPAGWSFPRAASVPVEIGRAHV
jgi:hypothetical protein